MIAMICVPILSHYKNASPHYQIALDIFLAIELYKHIANKKAHTFRREKKQF